MINNQYKVIKMSLSRTIIQIFVSSPSDVSEERKALESIIDELNRSWINSSNLHLELIRWETHTHPAFSSDPQSVINKQIGDSYDVFLGILWGRFGTPTPRSDSGTQEEFIRALKRHERDGIPKIMIYFKDTPISPSRIDLDQMQKVQEFRNNLTKLGGLYSIFEDMPSFESSLRSHLSALVREFTNNPSENKTRNNLIEVANSKSLISIETDLEDDFGLLDYLEIYQAKMDEMSGIVNIISDATIRIGEQLNRRTSEIKQLGQPITGVNAARRIIKRSAEDFLSYSETLNKNIPLFSAARNEAFQAMSNSIAMQSSFSKPNYDDLFSLNQSLTTMLDSIRGSKNSLTGFRQSVHSMPRMASELNKAKRAALVQLDSMLNELDKTDTTIINILDAVRKMQTRDL